MANPQLGDTEKVPYAIALLDGDSNPAVLDPTDTISVASADTASISVVPDAVPSAGNIASGFLVGGAKLQTGVAVTATLTPGAASKTKALTVTDLIDVVGGPAASMAFNLGTPVAQ
jgi:hypothetical protein